MKHAIDTTSYVAASAEQAFLEAEPAERGSKLFYELRYLKFSANDLNAALELFARLEPAPMEYAARPSKGRQDATAAATGDKEANDEALVRALRLTAADCMLARDKTERRIAMLGRIGVK